MLRRGNKASAKYWRRVLLPVIQRYRGCDIPKFFRGGAAFAIPALYGVLEKEGTKPPSASSPMPCWSGKSSIC